MVWVLGLFDRDHSKYWQIGVLGIDVHVRFGRADMQGGVARFLSTTKQVTSKPSFEEARIEAESRYDAQMRQGYKAVVPADKSSVYRPKRKSHASKKRVSIAASAKQIHTVEEFDVRFIVKKTGRAARGDRRGLPNYAGRYKRRLNARKKVKNWVRIRFRRVYYPDELTVEVLDGTGRPVPMTRSLKSVRASYVG